MPPCLKLKINKLLAGAVMQMERHNKRCQQKVYAPSYRGFQPVHRLNHIHFQGQNIYQAQKRNRTGNQIKILPDHPHFVVSKERRQVVAHIPDHIKGILYAVRPEKDPCQTYKGKG